MASNRVKDYFDDGPLPQPIVQKPSKATTALEERQEILAHYVRLVARRQSNGLFVFGRRGGLGKSKIILETLAAEWTQPVILNGHCTPLSLYSNLQANPDAVIFLDDCDSLFNNLPALGILRSALWGQSGERLVTYNSSALRQGSSFYFSGSVIACANVIPQKNAAFQAVLSRIDTFELDATNLEIIDVLRKLAVNGFGDDLTATECLEVVNYIAEFASTRELSLRLLEPSFKKVVYARQEKIDWRDLVRSQLEQIGRPDNVVPQDGRAFERSCLEQVLEAHPDSPKDQVDAWCRATGKSRPTFYRLLKEFRDSNGASEC